MPHLELSAQCKAAGAAVAIFLAGGPGCGTDLAFGVRNLEISPNPAQPGDEVAFQFWLTVVPEQDYSITAFVDSTGYLTTDAFEAVDRPFVLQVGAADSLIARYGLGTHSAYVEVRLKGSDHVAQTSEQPFVLEAGTQPSPRDRGNP